MGLGGILVLVPEMVLVLVLMVASLGICTRGSLFFMDYDYNYDGLGFVEAEMRT